MPFSWAHPSQAFLFTPPPVLPSVRSPRTSTVLNLLLLPWLLFPWLLGFSWLSSSWCLFFCVFVLDLHLLHLLFIWECPRTLFSICAHLSVNLIQASTVLTPKFTSPAPNQTSYKPQPPGPKCLFKTSSVSQTNAHGQFHLESFPTRWWPFHLFIFSGPNFRNINYSLFLFYFFIFYFFCFFFLHPFFTHQIQNNTKCFWLYLQNILNKMASTNFIATILSHHYPFPQL